MGALPAPVRGRPVLVMTVGLPGSGKSTFAGRLGPQIQAVVLESDALRRLLNPAPTHSPRENFILFRSIHAAARELLDRGISVIVDATSLIESDRRPLYRVAEETGARLVVVETTAPEDLVLARLGRRLAGETTDSSDAGPEVYARMAERYQPVRRPHWVVDTSDPASTEAALAAIIDEAHSIQEQAGSGERR